MIPGGFHVAAVARSPLFCSFGGPFCSPGDALMRLHLSHFADHRPLSDPGRAGVPP